MVRLFSGLFMLRGISGDYVYRLLIVSLIAFFFVLSSCKKDNKDLYTDEITLSSKKFDPQNFYVMGYSFEYQTFLKTFTTSTDVDIYLVDMLNPKGELSGVQFSTSTSSESTYGFSLDSTFADLPSAVLYYDGYTTAVADNYSTITQPVHEFQVYTFRTRKSNYVKFLVKELRTYSENDIADYIEVDIKYFIQHDGSTNLTVDD